MFRYMWYRYTGKQARSRGCKNGVPGRDCQGAIEDVRTCNHHEYPKWATCSASCAAGEQSRTRVCTNGTAGEDCIGPQKQVEHVIPNHARYGLCGPGSENVLRRVVLVNKREIERASLEKRKKIVSKILKISGPVTRF